MYAPFRVDIFKSPCYIKITFRMSLIYNLLYLQEIMMSWKLLEMTWDYLNLMTSLNVEFFFQKDIKTYLLGLKEHSET